MAKFFESRSIKRVQKRLFGSRERIITFITIVGVVFFIIYKVGSTVNGLNNNPVTSINNALTPKIVLKDYACNASSNDGTATAGAYVAPSTQTISRYASSIVGTNLISNSDLSKLSSGGQPTSFSHSEPVSKGTGYSLLRDEQSLAYLRSTSYHDLPENDTVAWLPAPTPIKLKAYYFSFLYKSTAGADLSIEYTSSSGVHTYTGYNELSKVSSWQRIEGSYDNYSGGFVSARLIIALKGAGNLDVAQQQVFELSRGRLGSGMVSVSFDDSWQSIYNEAMPLLKKYNIRSTQFVIPGYNALKAPDYMDIGELKKLQEDGNEISSHSLKHCNQTELTTADLIYDLAKSKSLLENSGIKPTGYAYPYGAYNYITEAFVKQNYSYARITTTGYNDYFTDIYKIKTQNVYSTTSQEDIKAWADYAREHRLWLVLVYHRIGDGDAYSTSKSELDMQLAAIKDSGLTILPIRDALKRF